jgi:hypothetical protein
MVDKELPELPNREYYYNVYNTVHDNEISNLIIELQAKRTGQLSKSDKCIFLSDVALEILKDSNYVPRGSAKGIKHLGDNAYALGGKRCRPDDVASEAGRRGIKRTRTETAVTEGELKDIEVAHHAEVLAAKNQVYGIASILLQAARDENDPLKVAEMLKDYASLMPGDFTNEAAALLKDAEARVAQLKGKK